MNNVALSLSLLSCRVHGCDVCLGIYPHQRALFAVLSSFWRFIRARAGREHCSTSLEACARLSASLGVDPVEHTRSG